MLLTRLELKNFLAYRGPIRVEFYRLGLAVLSGPNGAGKSSLLDGITWALWGRARAKADEELIHAGQTEMRATVEFVQDDKLYRVERERKAKSASAKLRLLAYSGEQHWSAVYERKTDASQWTTLYEGVRDAQPQILRLLRLSYDTFINSAFLQQGKADAFTTRTPKERRDVLREILGLEQWAVYEKRAKDQRDAIDAERQNLEFGIREREEEIKRAPEYQQRLETAQARLVEVQTARADAEIAFERVRGAADRLQEANQELEDLHRRSRAISKDLSDLDIQIMRRAEQLQKFNDLIEQGDQIEHGVALLEEARANDKAFRKRERDYKDLEKEQDKLLNAIERETHKLQTEADTFRKAIRKAEDTSAKNTDIQESITLREQKLTALETRQTELTRTEAQLSESSNELTRLYTEIDALEKEQKALRVKYQALEPDDLADAYCPVCGQPLDEDHRQALFEEADRVGRQNKAQIADNQTSIQELKFQQTQQEQFIRKLRVELSNVATYQTELAQYYAKLDALKETLAAAERDRAALAHIEHLLAIDEYAHAQRERLGQVETIIQSIGYDRAAHDQTEHALEELRAFERRSTDLQHAREQAPLLLEELAAAEGRKTRTGEELEALRAKLVTVEERRTALTEDVTQETLRRAELNEARKREQAMLGEKMAAEQALIAVEGARKRAQELRTKLHDALRDWSQYEKLREAFSQSGVPAMIIEAAIPELESQTNRLLSMISDGQMHIRFLTQKENRAGNTVEALDLLISDPLGTRDYSMYSGGESFRVNFAVRVALSQFLAHRAGSQLKTLFIDEGFGSQDSFGRERLVEAINRISDEFDLILVVTHIDELRDAFQNHIRVQKEKDGSQVVLAFG